MDNFVNSLLTRSRTLTTVRAAGEVCVAESALPVGDDRIIAHLQFARAVASRSIDPRCRGADREDLVAWGLDGLVQAARRYRGDRGASFGAYAARRVRGQILDALRERDPLTRSARRAFRAAQRASEESGVGSPAHPPYVEVSLDRIGDVAEVHRTPEHRDARWPLVASALRDLTPLEQRAMHTAKRNPKYAAEIGRAIPLAKALEREVFSQVSFAPDELAGKVR